MKKIIVLMVVLLSILCTTAAVADEPLFVAKDGLKPGYINAQGEWVIEPRFNQAWPFTSAGYAAVVEEYDKTGNTFTLIDRQGNIVTKLSEWTLNFNTKGFYGETIVPDAAGNGFVLRNKDDSDRYALFLAGTGKLIELNQEYLGFELSPGAKQNEVYFEKQEWQRTLPDYYCISEWNGRLILEFRYTDFKRGGYSFNVIDVNYAFIILDSEGNKLHDGIFRCNDEKGIPVPGHYSQQVTDTYMVAGDTQNYNDHLIDCDGRIILKNVDESFSFTDEYDWDETLQAVYEGNFAMVLLPDGRKMTDIKRIEEQAPLTPCGILKHDGWYYDTQGERIKWHGASEKYYMALSAFGRDGLAWINRKPENEWDNESDDESEDEPEDISDYNVSTLIDTRGQIILKAVLHDDLHDLYKQNPAATPFEYGWECVYSPEDGWKYGYVNPDGEMMFGGYLFDDAEPFSNGLAHARFLGDKNEMLDLYINPGGKVVWAAQGKREEVQKWLDEKARFTTKNMTVEEATRALVGEWDCTSGGEHLSYPVIFYEDGTCHLGIADHMLCWKLIENTFETDGYYKDYQVVLLLGDNPEELENANYENGYGIEFCSTEWFNLTDWDGGSTYVKENTGYWESAGYQMVPDEDGKFEQYWSSEAVLPKEEPNFKLTDKSIPEETAGKGVYAFRGSPYRQNASVGTVRDICVPEVLWEKDIGPAVTTEDIYWQPLIAEWSDEFRKSMTSLKPEKREDASLTEVIAVGTDGKIWFADLKTGKDTRDPIIGKKEQIHGTPTILSATPLLICPSERGFVCYDLTDGSRRTETDAILKNCRGKYATYQNGWLLIDDPEVRLAHIGLNVKKRVDGTREVEITDAYLTDYAIYRRSDVPSCADGGDMYATELRGLISWPAMKEKYNQYLEDTVFLYGRTAACAALDMKDDGSGDLYVGCMEFDSSRESAVYCIDKEKMLVKWTKPIKQTDQNPLLGGIFASPVVGREWLENIVYFTVAGYAFDEETPENRKADSAVVAYWKRNGEKKWETPIKDRAVSSPVIVYTEDGNGYLIQFDKSGNMYVLDGFLGTVKYSLELGGEVTSCPAVYGNTLVVRCQKDGREVLCGIEVGVN